MFLCSYRAPSFPHAILSKKFIASLVEHYIQKELIKVIDMLGRETKGTKNKVFFYIYNDGTVEKRIILE